MTTATLTKHRARATEVHEWSCAERIRLRDLLAAGEPAMPDVRLLHTIAAKIRQCCGHNGLRAHRLAWGWSVSEATGQVHALCTAQQLGARGLVARSWQEWESGRKRPNDDYVDLLCRLFQTSAVRLGYAPDYTPAPADPPAPTPVAGPAVDATTEPGPAPVVAEWTGRKAAALRTASRMSARAFAEHLGVAVNTVTYWQARPDRPLSLANQEVLDRAYKLADDDTKTRFALLARGMS
jgi:DNA-binding transcriptional regulator YiaG